MPIESPLDQADQELLDLLKEYVRIVAEIWEQSLKELQCECQ